MFMSIQRWRRKAEETRPVLYCKSKEPCKYKRIKAVQSEKRTYWVLCSFDGTCNQQTEKPQKIKLS